MNTIAPAAGIPVGIRPPKSWSVVAWAGVATLSVLISYLITALLGLASLLFGLLLLFSILTDHISVLGVILCVFTLVVGGTLLWALVPRKIPLQTDGVPISLSRETNLRAEIQALAAALNEKMPDEVYLIHQANAAVLQRDKKRILLLGLPVLQLLTVSQFRAVLAHEFGHFYAGDTRLGPWVFRARMNMAQVLKRLGDDSAILSIISRWAVVAVLRLLLIGGLSLWWNFFNRVTQHVSRKQEFRCDELACYLGGSENLEKGLCSIHHAAITFPPYWNQVVVPIAAGGFRPQLADGFARFVQVPEIANAASALVQKQLDADTVKPLDSHPPLNARVQNARRLAIVAAGEDTRPAVHLIQDLPSLELELLIRLMPALKPSELKPLFWDSVGSEVYLPLWRSQAAKVAPALVDYTTHRLSAALANLNNIAALIPDPVDTLLTREQRAARAAEAISQALALACVDHGWKLHVQPGQLYVENENGTKVHPPSLIQALQKPNVREDACAEFCAKHGIGDWPLAQPSAPANTVS